MRNYNIPIFNFSGHLGRINAVCVTRYNQIIYAVEDHTIRIWDVANKKLVHVFHSINKETKYLGLSSSEQYLFAGDPDGFLEIWDINDKSRFCRIQAFTISLTAAIFSFREDVILTAGQSDVFLIQKYKIDKNGSLKKVAEFNVEEEIKCMGLGDKNKIIYALGLDEIIQLSYKSLKLNKEYEHDNLVGLYFSNRFKYIIGVNAQGILRIWQSKNFKLEYKREVSAKDFPSGITMVKYIEDGNLLIIGDSNKLQIWDVKNDTLNIDVKTVKRKGKVDSINCIEFNPSHESLVLGCNDRLRIVDIQTGKNLQSIRRKPLSPPYHADYVHSELTQDGQFLICIRKLIDKTRSKQLIEIWDLSNLKKIHEIYPEMEADNDITVLKISPDSKFFVTGDNAKKTGGYIWNLKTGKRRKKLKELDYGVNAIFITKDSSIIITSDATFDIEVFESKTGKMLRKLSSSTKNVSSFAMTRDSNTLICGYRDIMDRSYDIIIWNFETGEIEHMLSANIDFEDKVIWVGFSEDEKHLVAKSSSGYTITFERKNWKIVSSVQILDHQISPYPDNQVYSYPLAENIILSIAQDSEITPSMMEFLDKWSKKMPWISLSRDSFALSSEVSDLELAEYKIQLLELRNECN